MYFITIDSELSDTESTASTRRERFFWQYNVQAKGPKGQRLVLAPTQEGKNRMSNSN